MPIDAGELQADFEAAAGDWNHSIVVKRPTQTQGLDGTETQSLATLATATGVWMPLNLRQQAQLTQRLSGLEGTPTHRAFLPAGTNVVKGDLLVYGAVTGRVLGLDRWASHLQVWVLEEA